MNRAARKSPRGKAAPRGDCFEAAFRYLTSLALDDPRTTALLVHGEVAGQGSLAGITFAHGWVLVGDFVVDVSNGLNVLMPREDYYRVGRIAEINNLRVYTWEQARKWVHTTENYGPWELTTASGL